MAVHQQDTSPNESRSSSFIRKGLTLFSGWPLVQRGPPFVSERILRVFSHRSENWHLTEHTDFLILSSLSGMILT